MANYLREQSAGEIIRNTFEIYGRNFWELVLAYTFPILPIIIFRSELTALFGQRAYWSIYFFTYVFIYPFVSVAITVIVSDACLGNRPSLRRAFRKVFSSTGGKVFAPILINLCGFILSLVPLLAFNYFANDLFPPGKVGSLSKLAIVLILLVPPIIYFAWVLLTFPVIVLEGLSKLSVIKRSKALGRGFYMRNLGVVTTFLAVYFVWLFIQEAIFLYVLPKWNITWGHRAIFSFVECLFEPVLMVALVLIYYDVRSRKESYDIAMLAQDLRR